MNVVKNLLFILIPSNLALFKLITKNGRKFNRNSTKLNFLLKTHALLYLFIWNLFQVSLLHLNYFLISFFNLILFCFQNLARQRSLIKTNPWLPSPWFNRENSHCSRSSSSSDSLCHVRDHSSNENIYSKNGLQAQINLNPGLNFHHNLTKFESSNDEPLTTSDEDSQSYSSNIYSSCSNVTKEYDSSVNQALTRFELNKVKEKHFSSQYYNLLSQYLYKKKKRFQPHYSKLVRYPYPSVYKNYSKSNFEEKWVHTVTDLISLASFENELDQLDLILENNDRDIPSPNLKHPSFHFDYNQYTQNSFHPSSSTNSEITFNDQLSQTSPLTADSGYDISEISENDSQCLEEPSTLMYPNICSTEILKSKIQNVKREMNNSIQYEQLRQKQWDILNQIIV